MVHLASRVTEEVFSFLGPATAAMAQQGVRQAVIVLDDPSTRSNLAKFGADVELHRVPLARIPFVDLLRLRAELQAVLRAHPAIAGIHLHGVLPSLVGARLASACTQGAAVYFSPHASRLLAPLRWAGRLLVGLAQLSLGRLGQRAIVNVGTDAARLREVPNLEVDLVESPVAPRYFKARRREAPHPLIVGGGNAATGDEALDSFVQFVVLLRDSVPGSEFVWLAEADGEQRLRLKAANVRCLELGDEVERLECLSRAWLYVAPPGGRGVPVGLVEAMACGVACVAGDTSFHRDVVIDGVTGLLYAQPDEALEHVALLIDSAEMRSRLGQAARSDAQRRFQQSGFCEHLMRAYRHEGVGAPALQAAGAVASALPWAGDGGRPVAGMQARGRQHRSARDRVHPRGRPGARMPDS
jgi:glycosyltransferase involved in cell wall biosynthesis